MINIDVNLKSSIDNSYKIFIGTGLIDKLIEDLERNPIAFSYAIITDSNVSRLYGKGLIKKIQNLSSNTLLIDFPAGEEQKNRDTKTIIENKMLEANFGRDSAVIALGGGVVGDIAGYVAATYTRGIPYIQLPTTLVACVDSSIGGKTAIDTEHGKNLIGAFHQPESVYIDINTLKTLDAKEIREGLAEIIKYGVIADKDLFILLEQRIEEVFEFDENLLSEIINSCCKIKANVVEKDEKESNLRKILNFGHTIGHAIEKLSDFTLSHGNAISIGMVLEGKIAAELKLWDKNDLDKLEILLSRAGLPTKIPFNAKADQLIETMKIDKKSRRGNIEMALPSMIGEMARENGKYSIIIDNTLIKKLLSSDFAQG
ncbi:MAG: 3-dehydroquinate synthase [Thermodesulfobacteriota bacterium]